MQYGVGTSDQCPTVNPDPGSVKVDESVRWANATSYASFVVMEANGGPPLETVPPGEVGGWLTYSSAQTVSYRLTMTLVGDGGGLSQSCPAEGGVYTLDVTVN